MLNHSCFPWSYFCFRVLILIFAAASVEMHGIHGQVSYGQLRLALFARALVRPRRLLLLDEPFDGLDAVKVVRVRRELEDAVRLGTQLVVASHHQEDVPGHALNVLEFGRGGRWRVTSRDAARGT